MKFNSNKERRAYWLSLQETFTSEELEAALQLLKPVIREILLLHYREGLTFLEIAAKLKRSVSIIRNHHNRGIYQLYRHFNPRFFGTA